MVGALHVFDYLEVCSNHLVLPLNEIHLHQNMSGICV